MPLEDWAASDDAHGDGAEALLSTPSSPQWTSTDIEVISTSMRAGSSFELHTHEEDQLAWMASGSMELSVESDRWHLRRDHAAWIPAGVPHEMRFTEAGRLVSAYVHRRHRPDLSSGNRALALAFDPLGGALLLHLGEAHRSERRQQACARILLDLVAEAPVSHDVVALPQDPRARSIALALLSAPEDTRNLREWAAQEGVSAKTIARAFLADTGRTFREWRVRARLHVASGQLRQGNPVHAVAHAVGYESVSSFVTAFRERFGVTPAAYAGREHSESTRSLPRE